MSNKNFAVGVFVAIALAAFVFGTIWLTGNRSSEPTINYSMYFETDVGGLMLGGPVFYLGVEVGTVTAMTIIPGDPMRVRVDAEIRQSTPIDSGTYASLALQGITGVAVIKLSADPGVHEPLQPLKANGRDDSGLLVIKVRDTGFNALLSKAPDIVERMDDVLIQINQILGQENRDMVRSVLADLATVSAALAEQRESISEIPVSLNKALAELQTSLLQIRTMTGDLEPELDSIMKNIDMATADLAQVSARLDAWTSDNDAEMNAFMQDGLGQVPALVGDTRRVLREIEKLVKDLRENPSKLIHEPQEAAVKAEQ